MYFSVEFFNHERIGQFTFYFFSVYEPACYHKVCTLWNCRKCKSFSTFYCGCLIFFKLKVCVASFRFKSSCIRSSTFFINFVRNFIHCSCIKYCFYTMLFLNFGKSQFRTICTYAYSLCRICDFCSIKLPAFDMTEFIGYCSKLDTCSICCCNFSIGLFLSIFTNKKFSLFVVYFISYFIRCRNKLYRNFCILLHCHFIGSAVAVNHLTVYSPAFNDIVCIRFHSKCIFFIAIYFIATCNFACRSPCCERSIRRLCIS